MDPKDFTSNIPRSLPDENARATEVWKRAIWPKNELDNWDLNINTRQEKVFPLSQKDYDTLFKTFESNLALAAAKDNASFADSMHLTMALVRNHPDVFQIDRVMTGHCTRIYNTNVHSLSRAYKFSYTDDYVLALKQDKGNAWKAELYDLVLQELGHDLKMEAATIYSKHGWLICPFIPVQMVVYADIQQMTQQYKFTTRYGYIPESAKLQWKGDTY